MCTGSSTLPSTDTTNVTPGIVLNGSRRSFIGTGQAVIVRIGFPLATTETVQVSVAETTLFNPLWSTFGGFETFYRFQNSTNSSCNVTLRMVNDAGAQVANPSFAIPANSTAPTRTTGPTDLNLANDQAGQAIITHDCPPGAIQVDGFLGLFGAQTNVLPIRIQTARQMR